MRIFLVLLTACVSLLAQNNPERIAVLDDLAALLSSNSDEQFRLDILTGIQDALKGRRNVATPKGWEAVESELARSGNSQIRSLAQSLSLVFGSQNALASLRKTAADSAAALPERRAALEALLGIKDAGLPPILTGLLQDSNLRAAALKGLALYDDPQTSEAILKVYESLTTTEKRDALNTLSARANSARRLLDAVDKEKVPRKDLTAEIIRQLRNLKNEELNQQLTKVWGVARDSAADKQQEIEKYRRIYRAGGSQPGDAIRGRAVFVRVCQQCHTLFDTGGKVGPDLTGSNRSDLDYILQNMVDPNAVIPNDYRSSTLETKDERVITGIITAQDDKAVTIASANETLVIPRNEIQSIQQSDISMMPEGLLATLADQEVRDLIYYLRSPAQVPLIASADNLASFFNGKDLTGWDGDPALWKVENGEIIGKSLTGLKENDFLKGQMMFADFRLVCKVKLTPNKENSGIQFRSEVEPSGSVKGYQADVGAGWWGKLYEEHGRALLWDKSGEAHVKPEDWNTYEIVAAGSKIRTAINGKPCVDLDDPKGAAKGIFAFQLHSGGPMEVRFKDFHLEVNPKFELITVEGK